MLKLPFSSLQSKFQTIYCSSDGCTQVWETPSSLSCLKCTSTGKRSATFESAEQTRNVKQSHVHPRYVEGRPDNDLAVIELRDRITFNKDVFAACLPERDFAESVLIGNSFPTVITGWEESTQASSFEGPLTLNHLSYGRLPNCLEAHPNLVTNKMGCTSPQANADCTMGSGSPLLTLYKEVFFLTGVVSQPPGANCTKGYIFQKVSRHLGWLQPLMNLR